LFVVIFHDSLKGIHMSWYSTGSQKVEEQQRLAQEQRDNQAPFRVFMKPGEERVLIYLDEEGFSFNEHTIQVGSRWTQFTCSGVNNGCPLCKNDKSYLITLFSVVELSEWVDKRGTKHTNEVKIHALKPEAAMSLLKKKARWGGLIGRQVIVGRKGDKDAASGSDFELQLGPNGTPLIYAKDKLLTKYQLVDYLKYFAPKPPDDVAQLAGIAPIQSFAAPTSSRSSNSRPAFNQPSSLSLEQIDPGSIGGSEGDDSVPF
jgi:hypothetical protein